MYKNISKFIRKCFSPFSLMKKNMISTFSSLPGDFSIYYFHFNTFLKYFFNFVTNTFEYNLLFYRNMMISSFENSEHEFSKFSIWTACFSINFIHFNPIFVYSQEKCTFPDPFLLNSTYIFCIIYLYNYVVFYIIFDINSQSGKVHFYWLMGFWC